MLLTLAWHTVTINRRKMQYITQQYRQHEFAQSGVALLQAKLTPPSGKEQKPEEEYAHLFNSMLATEQYALNKQVDHMDTTLTMRFGSELGKLNINSLYDFVEKKFIKPEYEKTLEWICDTAAGITQTVSIAQPLKDFLKNRDYEINDIVELLSVPEIAQAWNDKFFLPFDMPEKPLYLADIFTVSTLHEGVSVWWLSPSFMTLLNLEHPAKMEEQELQNFIQKLTDGFNTWNEKTWDNCLAGLYKKKYADLAQDIKSILTSLNKANIFSLLLKAKQHDDSAMIYAIGQSSTKQHLIAFDIIKLYQV